MASEFLVFVHLSDIHFSSQSGNPDDLDDDLRNQLLRDAPDVCKSIGPVAAILVSGDIAARAKYVEYEYARQWLDRLCAALGTGAENVLPIPGNHDVDRTKQDEDMTASMARSMLRRVEETEIDGELARCHRDPNVTAALYRPLENYNKFALPYAIDATNRWCEAEYVLNDGSVLKVRGVNSTIVSDASDDQRKAPLIVGTFALQIPEEDGVSHVLMCHHPPSWLRDRNIDGAEAGRAKLQLFGHEHDQTVIQHGNTVRVFAGALHPERKTNWQPRYNVIALIVDEEAKRRVLRVEVHARAWNRTVGKFVPDNAITDGKHVFDLGLPPWNPPIREDAESVETASAMEGSSHLQAHPVSPESDAPEERQPAPAATSRRLAYRFYRLSIPKRWNVVRHLDYLDLKDPNPSSTAFFTAVFDRARADSRLGELWKLVEEEHGDDYNRTNPFEGQ